MKLLFVTPTPPDRLDRDGMTQIAFMLIRYLGRAHEIDVWSLTDTDSRTIPKIPGTKSVRLFPSLPTSLLGQYLTLQSLPYFQGRYESPTLHAELATLDPGAYDLVIFHTPFVAHYIRDTRLPAVVHVIDAMSDWFPKAAGQERNLFRRLHLLLEGQKASNMEREILPKARALVVVSDADALTIHHAAPNTRVECIPIGIDTETFFPPTGPRDPATVIMTGIMNYPPNVDAAEYFVLEAWPAIHHSLPQSTLRIVGRNPDPRVSALSQVPGVVVTGQVPSMADELRRATVAVSPLRFGTGYKIKVNEALACGTPLVASPVSIPGTGVRPNETCLIADSAPAWISTVERLLRQPDQRATLSQHALLFATTRAWPEIARRYEKMYEQLIAK